MSATSISAYIHPGKSVPIHDPIPYAYFCKNILSLCRVIFHLPPDICHVNPQDPIVIPDEEFGLWYLDALDNRERYDGKTVEFRGKVMIPRKFPENAFIPGRNCMTCCANDIRFMGFICHSKYTDRLKQKQWLDVTAEVRYEFVPEY